MSDSPVQRTADESHGFGMPRLQPHADLINSKHRLDYAITDLVTAFCKRHDFQPDQIQVVVTYTGCYVKVTI